MSVARAEAREVVVPVEVVEVAEMVVEETEMVEEMEMVAALTPRVAEMEEEDEVMPRARARHPLALPEPISPDQQLCSWL